MLRFVEYWTLVVYLGQWLVQNVSKFPLGRQANSFTFVSLWQLPVLRQVQHPPWLRNATNLLSLSSSLHLSYLLIVISIPLKARTLVLAYHHWKTITGESGRHPSRHHRKLLWRLSIILALQIQPWQRPTPLLSVLTRWMASTRRLVYASWKWIQNQLNFYRVHIIFLFVTPFFISFTRLMIALVQYVYSADLCRNLFCL
jgi:hypothetical protein